MTFKEGDRVSSIVLGLHANEPGEIVGEAVRHYGRYKRYLIRLEGSGREIELPENFLQREQSK